MSIPSSMSLCYGAIPEPNEASIRPTHDPPPGRAGDWADAILLLVQDRDRIAAGMHDLVVHRLFSAGLYLETALGLIGDHPGARKVQEAIDQLDLAIRDVRNVLFDHHQPDPPSGGQPGQGSSVRSGQPSSDTRPGRVNIASVNIAPGEVRPDKRSRQQVRQPGQWRVGR